MTVRTFLGLALVLATAVPVCGAGESRPPAMPEPELIEFLGNVVTAGGTVVDPLVFADEDAPTKPAKRPRQPRQQQKRKPVGATNRQDTERIER